MVKDHIGAQTAALQIWVEEGIHHTDPVFEHVGQADGGQSAGFIVGIFYDPRPHRGFFDHGSKFEHIHVGHTAIGMAGIQIPTEKGVLLIGGPG